MKPKIIAMYLPQFHEIEENNLFWGKGYTDWVAVKNATPLFEGHQQPRIPFAHNYYDLSKKESIRRQANLAKNNGVYGFGIYHYWFSSEKQVLTKPAEIILQNKDIDINYCFAWDNGSWKRSWDNIPGNDWAPLYDKKTEKIDGNSKGKFLLEYKLGGRETWEKHFYDLLPYFQDNRYIQLDKKPLFIIWSYSSDLEPMIEYWNLLAVKEGFSGISIMFQDIPVRNIPKKYPRLLYQPSAASWGRIPYRIKNKLFKMFHISSGLKVFNYEKIWKNLIQQARGIKDPNLYYGAFVGYDDTPRRGSIGTIVQDQSPETFYSYMKKIFYISEQKNKEYIFLTAWNEWAEGAYLEPDVLMKDAYLCALKAAYEDYQHEKK